MNEHENEHKKLINQIVIRKINAIKNLIINCRGRSVSSEQDNSESEHSEKSPLVSTKSLAKLLFSRSMSTQDNGPNRDSGDSPTRLIRKNIFSILSLSISYLLYLLS